MAHGSGPTRRGVCLSPTDPRLLGDPIDFIAEDHLRIRAMCGRMDRLAEAREADPDEALEVLAFLKEELFFLVADEESDLMPLLIRRSTPEDDMRRLKTRLTQEHREILAQLPEAVAAFRALACEGGPLAAETAEGLRDFAARIRRHLILENAIVLPFARLRLTDRDRDSLARGMLRRRGLDRLLEKPDAE